MTGQAPAAASARDRTFLAALPVLALVLFWTVRLAARPEAGCFLDLVNLAFHEAGHLFLAPFGSTLHYLGGTLGQLAVPSLLAAYFLVGRPSRPLGAAFCAWWIGENLVSVSIYMGDARDLALPLVGGGDHDWNEIFYRFGLLGQESVRAVSGVTRGLGFLAMLAGAAWVALFLLPAGVREGLPISAVLSVLQRTESDFRRGCCSRRRRSSGRA